MRKEEILELRKKIPYLKVKMLCKKLKLNDSYRLPKGYSIRFYKEGDAKKWAFVEAEAGEYDGDEEACYKRFIDDFGDKEKEMEKKCLFLISPDNEVIGTAMALNEDLHGKKIGMLGWVGIIPDYQGKGLSYPLIQSTLQLISKDYDEIILDTQTVSYIAIKSYLKFGFKPYLKNKRDKKAWELISKLICRDLLSEF